MPAPFIKQSLMNLRIKINGMSIMATITNEHLQASASVGFGAQIQLAHR